MSTEPILSCKKFSNAQSALSQKNYLNFNKFVKINFVNGVIFGEDYMLIMREPGAENKIQFRIRMTESVYKEIDDYCQWAGIRVRDYFIEKACQHIFKNDDDWIAFKATKTDSEK